MEYIGVGVLGILSLVLIGTVRPYRDQYAVLIALGVVVLCLHAVSAINALGGPLPGAEWDASTFHRRAAEDVVRKGRTSTLSIGTELYGYILTTLYDLFEPHKLLGQSLSIVAATGTLLCANAVALQMGVQNSHARAVMLLVMGLYPTFLFYNALTLREPYELVGFALGVFFMLKAIGERSIPWLLGALPSFLFMGGFHHILLGTGILIAGIGVPLICRPDPHSRRTYGIGAVLLVAIGIGGYLAIINLPATKGNDYVKELRQQGGLLQAIQNYREEIEDDSPRTSYSKPLDTSSYIGLVRAAAVNYWNYLSEPIGRNIETPGDAVPYLSALARILLFGVVIWLILVRRPIDPKLAYCVIVYVVLTGVWSIGTTNYGQAFRHHSLTDWLLVVMAASFFARQAEPCRRGPTTDRSE